MKWIIPQRCFRCGRPSSEWVCAECRAALGDEVDQSSLRTCPRCGQALLAEEGVCIDCSVQKWHFGQLWGLAGYHRPLGELLRLYKFAGASILADFWAVQAQARVYTPGPLIPVPPHAGHRRQREWDPVDWFSRRVARVTGSTVLRVLKRRATSSQKSLGQAERWKNANQSYWLAPGAARRLRSVPLVWLVDDVVTTGATVEACSRLLRCAGVEHVEVLTIGLR